MVGTLATSRSKTVLVPIQPRSRFMLRVVTGIKLNPRLAPMSASGGCERKLNGRGDLPPFETSREVSIIEPECGF